MTSELSLLEPLNVCPVCRLALTDEIRDRRYPHHKSGIDLERASELGCYICGTIRHSKTWSVKLDECLSSSFDCSRSVDNNGFPNTLYGLLIGAVPSGYGWAFQLWKEPDLVGSIGSYLPPESHHDSALINLATEWLESCCQMHSECQIQDPVYRPTRLVEIIDTHHVRLVSPIDRPVQSTKYIAFSHCWGKVEAIKLLTNNFKRFQNGIHIQHLPNSYQEAVQLCLSMGFTYIWIDSLCIIQDSSEDWEREAKDMKRVYEHAMFNLCSATASDSSGTSFLSRHAQLLKPQRVRVSGKSYVMICDNLFHDDIAFCTLRSRAWVYQEWYLSKRSLIMGTRQLWWHCRQKLACEIWPVGVPEAPGGMWWKLARNLKEAPPSIDLNDMDAWNHRVQSYMKTKLTRETDRLIAFSGIVQSFGQSRRISQDYLAGLWRCHLPAALLWQANPPSKRSATYTAASWSWASLAGSCHVRTDPDILKEPCFVSVAQILPLCKKGTDGSPIGAVITLCGYLFQVEYRSAEEDFTIPGNHDTEGNLYLDETSENEHVVSHLSPPDLDNFDQWLEVHAARVTMRIQDVKGRFYFLFFSDKGEPYHFRFRGLFLYQPDDQSVFFYRAGYMDWEKLPGGISTDELSVRHVKSKVRIL